MFYFDCILNCTPNNRFVGIAGDKQFLMKLLVSLDSAGTIP